MQWRFVFGIFSLSESAMEAVVEATDAEGQRKRKAISFKWTPAQSPGTLPPFWLDSILEEARG